MTPGFDGGQDQARYMSVQARSDETPRTSSPPRGPETAPTGVENEVPYSCFSNKEKWGIISLISLASIFS
jgi:hypothetical protein